MLSRNSILPTAITRASHGRSRGVRTFQLGRQTQLTLKGVSLKVETTTLNGPHELLGVFLIKRYPYLGAILRALYDVGSLAGIAGMLGILFIMGWMCFQTTGRLLEGSQPRIGTPSLPNRSLTKRIVGDSEGRPEEDWALRPLIPGLTVPFSDLPTMVLSLLTCQIIHEGGHAIAAAIDDIPLLSAGASVVLLFPSAFVSLPSSYASRRGTPGMKTTFGQICLRLRVATSGAWNNLLLWLLIMSIGWTGVLQDGRFWTVGGLGFWRNVSGQGVAVLGIMKDSPLRAHIPIGSIVTRLDDTYLAKSSMVTPSWGEYLLREVLAEEMDGWCVPRTWFESQSSGCCRSSGSTDASSQPSGLCFVPPSPNLLAADSQRKAIEGGRCVDPLALFLSGAGHRQSRGSVTRCHVMCMTSSGDTTGDSEVNYDRDVCIRPRRDVELLRIYVELPDWEPSYEGKRTKTIVWNGPRQEILEQISIGQLQPRFSWVPNGVPGWADSFISYLTIITLSLFAVNLLPIPQLDGGQVLSAALDLASLAAGKRHEYYSLEQLEGGRLSRGWDGNVLEGQPPSDWKQQTERVVGISTAVLLATLIQINSPDIERASLHVYRPLSQHVYMTPFMCLYPLLAYTYYFKYDEWIKSEEWTFVYCVGLGAFHALSFLSTRWSTAARTFITTRNARDLEDADCISIIPVTHRGQGEIVPLSRRVGDDPLVPKYTFSYQRDTYTYSDSPPSFQPLPYPSSLKPPLSDYEGYKGLNSKEIPTLLQLFGGNEFNIPIPSFTALFVEHATAPFFVFQVFCVALWCLDEYWYYSLFTLFMLIVFECTVVFQRVRTLQEFRTMSIDPYPIQCFRDGKWLEVHTDKLLPGDLVSIVRSQHELSIPADLLLLKGTCIVNEAMLSGESTPLLKESIELREGTERLDIDGPEKGSILYGGTKVLQSGGGDITPDGGCLAAVLRTGFGTTQGQLVRTMIFSTERVTANNFESFLFIGFLLIFAIAASWYVWVKGIERGLKKSKLLLDCVLIITSVVPPELPMELSLAVNSSLAALAKYAIFCTEPFRIPSAGRVDVCCFDKTGTITAEDLILEGVAGIDPTNKLKLLNVKETDRETTLCLASAHALVKLDDGTVVGDPMEKTALEALDWTIGKANQITPVSLTAPHRSAIHIRRRFQFSSALKRMSTISTLQSGKIMASVKGAPETIKGMLAVVPEGYDDTYKYFTRRGSRVLALGYKEMLGVSVSQINHLPREQVESQLSFVGFLVFSCPLKPDAIESLKMLADSSHRCIMITGDNPLTAVHVAREVEIVDREALILDLKEDATHEGDLTWRTVDETTIIPVDPSEPIDEALFDKYDICMTGAALKQYENRPSWNQLVQNTWVYARVSPTQKELILTTLKTLGYTTLMAGDGTNDVGALKQAHIGVALLDGTPEDLQKIAEHARNERIKKVYETQLKMSARFNQPPPPVPQVIAHIYPELVEAQQKALALQKDARKKNPMEKFDLASITNAMAEMDDENEPPKIKLGDASCAAPFTSKLSNVSAITHIIRQGRCTLVATIQMYKILALNCLISAYSLSVQYLDGIKFGDYQVTVTGMLMSVCFMCISRAKPIEKLSRERPLSNIFNYYVSLSVLLQFAIHIAALLYITRLSNTYEERGPIDLEAKFEPNLLNTAIYLLSLSQQVSTFAINFQGRPFREGITENRPLFYGLVAAGSVAFSGATDFIPELNRWLQIVEMESSFRVRLTATMIIDFVGCWLLEVTCKYLFADLEPKPMVTRGRERREARRIEEERSKKDD